MPKSAATPPLFIPLKREYFDAFLKGEKTEEYRPYGPRWNERTCPPGRHVTLSCGYGKKRRLPGLITETRFAPEVRNTSAWRACYGKRGGKVFAIEIWIAPVPEVLEARR